VKIAVVGGGGWGTTLALLLHGGGHQPSLWVYEADLAAEMRDRRENGRFLPGVPIPPDIPVTDSLSEAAAGAEALLLVTPSHALRGVATRLLTEAPAVAGGGLRWVTIATKGLERGTLLRMSQVLEEVLPEALGRRIAVLAGPSHAEEVARRVPTAVAAAARDGAVARAVQATFSTDTFRIYTNDDVVGVEIGVALKNVIAIAAGICDGLGFGDSTKGALLTRGLVEMARLGERLGARHETFSGLAGMGDLIATAMSRHSRNRGLGEAVGRGRHRGRRGGPCPAARRGASDRGAGESHSLRGQEPEDGHPGASDPGSQGGAARHRGEVSQ
jgi:glycerol-3-phosphate dehydrogenase (NAD(P)+)